MARTCKSTFEEMLVGVANGNVQALAYRALAASSLAEVYPEDEPFFRRIEIQAMQQLDQIPRARGQPDQTRTAVKAPRSRELAEAMPLMPKKTVAPALSAPSS